MTTKYQYAAIKTAQETTAQGLEALENVLGNKEKGIKAHPTDAHRTCRMLYDMLSKYSKSFKDCDPGWSPKKAAPAAAPEKESAPASLPVGEDVLE